MRLRELCLSPPTGGWEDFLDVYVVKNRCPGEKNYFLGLSLFSPGMGEGREEEVEWGCGVSD